jgi:leucyl aminopeptidase (aminopeptidase T)
MKAADVAFTATTHAITHTRARLDAADAGTRVVVLRGVTEDLMIDGGLNTDYETLAERTAMVRDALEAASTARVTSPSGTDIRMDLSGRPSFSLDGFFHEYGFSALPPGEAPVAPSEGSAEGTVVVDYSMDDIGLLEENIELTFEEGYVTAVSGGLEATKLRTIIDENDANAGNLAEFAIGTNSDARLIGNLAEDKKRLGTVHFAIGDNKSLGGSVRSNVHLDGVVLDSTVRLDDSLVLEDGELVLDGIEATARQ